MTNSFCAGWVCTHSNAMPSENRSLLLELEEELALLDAKGRRRTLVCLSGVNLCSNDYLGLAENRALKQALIEGIAKSQRVGATGSRLLSGHAAEWTELEEEFAAFAGTEAALYFGSGYAANLGLLTSILRKEDVVFSDERNHASLIDGIRLSGARKKVFPHRDSSSLETALRAHEGELCRKVIVTESIFSMDGDEVPLEEYLAFAERYGAELIVDEAHATGVHGPEGRGLVSALGAEHRVLATVHTCGKALASVGAFVCGSAVLKDWLINRARTFTYSTAQPPYMAHQVRAAVRLARAAEAQRTELLRNALRFTAVLRESGFDTGATSSQIVPVILGADSEAVRVAEELARGGFAARAIRPPTVPEGQARLRLSLTSRISTTDLDRLHAALIQARSRATPALARGQA